MPVLFQIYVISYNFVDILQTSILQNMPVLFQMYVISYIFVYKFQINVLVHCRDIFRQTLACSTLNNYHRAMHIVQCAYCTEMT